MTNDILSKIIICDYKDAAWITPEIKTAINRNSRVYKKWVRRGRALGELDKVREVRNVTSKFIRKAKASYYSNLGLKLSDPNTGQKYFWTTYKKLINKEVKTNIPPLMENGVFVNINQCTINDNGSVLPNFISKTDASLSHLSVSQEQIINIINNFNPNKSHGHDVVSVSMLKICDAEIALPLQLIFNDCISTGMFPDSWKYANNIQPIFKKENREIKSNYGPISLLPICGKILERIVFDQLYAFLNANNLLSKNQSGFRPDDSTICQLLSITSSIYEAFENYEETRAVFLDISKAFDKVWHEGLIYKLK